VRVRAQLIVAILLTTAIAAALRVPRLTARSMHADEAVQAARTRDLWLSGRYAYCPDEFHGPTLQYLTLPALWASGAKTFAESTETTYRLVPVVFGVASVLVVWLLASTLGRAAAFGAAMFLAVSPAAVFYSRYYIHETLLFFFTLVAIAAGWRAWRTGRWAWTLAAGAAVGLMQATKETAVLAYAAAAGAAALTWSWRRVRGGAAEPRTRPLPGWRHLAVGLIVAAAVAAVLFSSFLANPRGLLDAVLTYLPWLQRAGGESPHVHPWHFYLHRLCGWRSLNGPMWSEALLVVLAVVGSAKGLLTRPSASPDTAPASVRIDTACVQWLSFHTLLLAAMYTAIPYKTPWCMLQFMLGGYLLAGVGAVAVAHRVPGTWWKTVAVLLLAAPTLHLAWQAYRASFVMAADVRNPYTYAQTVPGVTRLAEQIEELHRTLSAQQEVPPIRVYWTDHYYWPLPWYFRRCGPVGYWPGLPNDRLGDGPLVVAAAPWDEPLAARIGDSHVMIGFFGVRPGVLAQVWVEYDLWTRHLQRLGKL